MAMASIPCGFNLPISWRAVSSSSSSVETLRSPFISATRRLGWLRPSSLRSKLGHASSGFRATSWFNFRKDSEGAGIYGSQSRDDFDRDDVEQVRFCFLHNLVFFFCPLFFQFGNFGLNLKDGINDAQL